MRHRITFVFLLFSFVLSACTSTPVPAPIKDFELSLDAPSLNLAQDQTEYLDIWLSGKNGFDEEVKLSLENTLPSGLTAEFTQATVSSALATLELKASSTVIPGVYSITVKGISGSLSKTTTLSLTIVEMARDFSFTLTPSLVNLVRGETQIIDLTVEFTQDFDKEVALSLERKDGGLLDELVEHDLPTTAGMWNSLLLTAKDNAPEGEYVLVLKGKADEITKAVELTLIISAVPDFAIGVEPGDLTLLPDQTKTLEVTIARAGKYSNAVAFSLTNDRSSLPYGLQAKFEPANTTGNTSTLTLTASETANMLNLETLKIVGKDASKTKETSFNLEFNSFLMNIDQVLSRTLSVNLGSSGSVVVNVGWRYNALEPVQLSLERSDGSPLPDGLVAAFDQSVLAKASDATPLRFSATEPLTVGTYNLRVKAVAAGATRYANLILTVNPKPDFTVSLDKTSFELDQGLSASATLTISRTNFTSYMLVSSDAPSGVSVYSSPYFIYGNSALLTISADKYAQPGTYNFQVTVSGNGVTKSIPMAVTVKFVPKSFTFTTSVGDGSSANSYTPQNITWFAFQDGDGPWQIVTGQDGKYTFNHASLKINLAMVHVKAREVNVYIEPLDLSRSYTIGTSFYTGTNTVSQGNRYQMTGSVMGVSTGDSSTIYFGGEETTVSGIGSYQLNPGRGSYSLSAFRYPQNSTAPDKMIIQRDVSLTQNTTLDLDFESSTAFTPQLFTVSSYGYPAPKTRGVVVFSPYYWFSALKLGKGQGTFQYAAVPNQYKRTGERYQVIVDASCPGNCSTNNSAWFDTATDVSLELLEPIPSASVQVVSTVPYVRTTAEFETDTSRDFDYSINYFQTNPTGGQNRWYVVVLPDQPIESYTLPDFSNLPGWNNQWGLSNTTFDWQVEKRIYEDSQSINEYKETYIYGRINP